MTTTLPPGQPDTVRPPRPVPGRGAPRPRRPAASESGPASSAARPAGPAGLRQRPAGTRAPARPGTRTRPAGLPARPRPGRAAGPAAARPGLAGQESRTRFVFLVLGLLVGALISLLLINTVLATGSYQITALQRANVQLAQQRQALQAQIASEQTPAVLYRRARQLGMVAPPLTHFLDLRKGRIISQPHRVPGVVTYPPG
ncbi:MAG: septum formation initiator family protein, partial [Gemmatimonadota bacterium]